jgi:uncharacterized Fe-S center protein
MRHRNRRRDFLKVVGAGAASTLSEYALGSNIKETAMPDVYMTKEITPSGLIAVHEALGRKLGGRVAVKISTGEPGDHHFLSPDLIRDLVRSIKGTIVECNTAYGVRRASASAHRKTAEEHGFTAIAPVDIMDEDGDLALPFERGRHIKEDFVGAHFVNYDSCLVLSHFKGHAMGGFGGAIKNMSIGIASAEGKSWIHTGGREKRGFSGDHTVFLESMAEAAGAVIDRLGENIAYINVMNHLSVDCDCASNPAPPEMDDIGILGSLDPVALDKACVDLIYAADTKRSASLRERIESRDGTHTLDYAQELGLGTQKYRRVML